MTLFALFLVLFLVSVFGVFYTYVLFPAILGRLARRKGPQRTEHEGNAEFVNLSILIAAYNEEAVIGQKLKSLAESKYPKDKLEVIVGSDASDDGTDEIVREYASSYPWIRVMSFPERRGKPSVINDLVAASAHELIILTDANVLFGPETLSKLVRHFRDPAVGLVGANILNIGMKKDGISIQEKSYIERENLIKYREGLLWGCMMGPFGGCFALRKNLFKHVPAGFLVDDFYISMKVLEKKYRCINDLDAICYEDVSNDVFQEYKRKARISAGNFQNLAAFRGFLWRVFTPAGFCFISHKFMRWITPFLILLSFVSLGVLSFYSPFFLLLFAGEFLLILAPLLDRLFSSVGIHFRLLRFVSYFSFMNLALLRGFFRYMRGVNSGVWTPTKRLDEIDKKGEMGKQVSR
jgi:cellulose synthase/poly-beta-1,6-N-acetylglucosamine synthase-like glycosyltransferase